MGYVYAGPLLLLTLALFLLAYLAPPWHSSPSVAKLYHGPHNATALNLPPNAIMGAKAIPRRIWTFWTGCLTQTILSFIQNWCLANPGYEITILTLDNYKSYIKGLDIEMLPNIEFPARISDIIRIHALAQHGGIWADASMLFTRSLDWILEMQQEGSYEFIGYYIGRETIIPTSPVIENWSFACAPGSQMCEDWRAEFMRLQSFPNASAYVNSVLSEGIVPGVCGLKGSPGNSGCLTYLAMHLAMQRVLQIGRNKTYAYRVMDYVTPPYGAYLYLEKAKWHSHTAIVSLMKGKSVWRSLLARPQSLLHRSILRHREVVKKSPL